MTSLRFLCSCLLLFGLFNSSGCSSGGNGRDDGGVDASDGVDGDLDADADDGSAGDQDLDGDDGSAGDQDLDGDDGSAGDEDPAGKCDNADDRAIIAAGEAQGGVTVPVTASECYPPCLSDADPNSCAKTCLVAETGLSEGCADCYIQDAACTVGQCMTYCTDPASQACASCREDHCLDDFSACSGLD